ncbi:MAG: hypothetical protein WA777_21520 [Rhodanobacter sp.]
MKTWGYTGLLAICWLMSSCATQSVDRSAESMRATCSPQASSEIGATPFVVTSVEVKGDVYNDPKKSIFAKVMADGCGKAEISAVWVYQDSRLINITTQQLLAYGPNITVFRLSNPNFWPLGQYHVDIKIGAKIVAVKHFVIDHQALTVEPDRP